MNMIFVCMKVLLFARRVQRNYREPLLVVLKKARDHDWQIYANTVLFSFIKKENLDIQVREVEDYQSLKEVMVDMVLTMGGDGTILGATCLIRDLAIPIIGINMGRLGFLAGIERKNIDSALENVASGNYHIETRSMLNLRSEPALFAQQNFALNDFTIHKRDNSSMITIHTYIDGEFLNSYWADGIIVATPTGSTGYSLSCGGPIIFPGSDNMIITPVAPHNLNVRPLVISDNSVISFVLEGRAKNYLCTLDSRHEKITSRHQLSVSKCEFSTHLVILEGQTFLRTIHEKLSWGSDRRN